MKEKSVYVLDSFAVIAFLNNEEGSDKVEKLLRDASKRIVKIFMHAINLGEVFYTVFREAGEMQALNVYGKVRQYPVEFIEDLSEPFLLSTAKIKGSYSISYADAFVVITAIEKAGIIVTGDPELKRVEMDKIVEILWIKNS